jgi:hypothetical protein
MLVDVILASTSGMVKDEVINSFVFLTPSTPPSNSDITAAQAAIIDFYNTVSVTNGITVANFLGTQLSRASNACRLNYYNLTGHLSGSPHGSPIATNTFTLGAAQSGETNMPAEVAGVLSYHSDLTDLQQELGSTRPAARARGRIFLGPLNTLARTIDGTTHQVTLSGGFRTSVTDAGARLILTSGVGWAQWSRRNALVLGVVGGYVDDSFDTQRRRGVAATLRTTFT